MSSTIKGGRAPKTCVVFNDLKQFQKKKNLPELLLAIKTFIGQAFIAVVIILKEMEFSSL